MKLFNLLLVVFGMTLFISCSDDDCVAADWVGTYRLDTNTQNCSSENVSLNEEVVIVAGTNANSISFDGTEVEVNGCSITVTDPLFGLSVNAELDGDEVKVDGLGCTGTYIKQ